MEKPTMKELTEYLSKIWSEKPDNKRNITMCLIGHEDEQGNVVCKGLDMFHELVKEEANKQFNNNEDNK